MAHHLARALAAGTLLTLVVSDAAAQAAPPPQTPSEHYGVGALGAIGWPGPLAMIRLSGPLAPRFGFDLDVGVGRESGDQTAAYAAQVRWLRTERRTDGTSDYGIFGVLIMDMTTRSDIRFPNERIVTETRAKRLSAQFGYGGDWQSDGGTRVGLELSGGGAGGEALGFRLFLKVFATWGGLAR